MKPMRQIPKWMVLSLMAFSLVGMGMTPALAKGYGHHGKDKHDLEKKFYKKVHFLDDHQQELGLTDDQMQQVWDLKFRLKKSMIEHDARIDTAKVDIMRNLKQRNVDVEATNALVDQKYEAKAAKAKAMVQAYADLKNIVSDQQYETMKSLWREKKRD